MGGQSPSDRSSSPTAYPNPTRPPGPLQPPLRSERPCPTPRRNCSLSFLSPPVSLTRSPGSGDPSLKVSASRSGRGQQRPATCGLLEPSPLAGGTTRGRRSDTARFNPPPAPSLKGSEADGCPPILSRAPAPAPCPHPLPLRQIIRTDSYWPAYRESMGACDWARCNGRRPRQPSVCETQDATDVSPALRRRGTLRPFRSSLAAYHATPRRPAHRLRPEPAAEGVACEP